MIGLKSNVINFYGAPSSFKSTTAAKLFVALKKAGISCEYITEYAKDWVWDKRVINKYDQIKIVSEQIYREVRLYGQVDYIITDSPAPLGCFYEEYKFPKQKIIRPMMKEFLKARLDDSFQYDYFLQYQGVKEENGRYHTVKQSEDINKELLVWLKGFRIEPVIWKDEFIKSHVDIMKKTKT